MKKIGGEFYVDGYSNLRHGDKVLFEPFTEDEVELATYIESIDAVLTKAKMENNVMQGGTEGAILTTDMYDTDTPFSAIYQLKGFKGTNTFLVDVKERKIANRTNAVLVRKKGDEYKWAYLFPPNAMYLQWLDAPKVLQCSDRGRTMYKNFSPFELKYTDTPKTFEVTYWVDGENKATINVSAEDKEDAMQKASDLLEDKYDITSARLIR